MSERTRAVLMPLVASFAGAFASHLAKKAPQYLEQRNEPENDEPQNGDELERRRRERAEHRAARRKAS